MFDDMRLSIPTVLACLISVAFCAPLSGQVYGQGTTGEFLVPLRVDEFGFTLGDWPKQFGFTQYRSRSGIDAPWIRWTSLSLGHSSIKIRTQLIAMFSILCFISFCGLVWLSRRQQRHPFGDWLPPVRRTNRWTEQIPLPD